jgi:hypothetical protein
MAGKPGAKNNAITHGAYAENLILPGESIREFKLLHRGLIDEWKPLGALEEDTVLTLAQCIWLKRRVDRFYHREASWAQQHPAEEEISDVGRRASPNIAGPERSYRRCSRPLQKVDGCSDS